MTNDNYITIPGYAVTVLKLSGNALVVYGLIYSYSRKSNQFFMSLSQIADSTNVDRRHVIRVIAYLLRMGYIYRLQETPFKPTVYACTPLEEIEVSSSDIKSPVAKCHQCQEVTISSGKMSPEVVAKCHPIYNSNKSINKSISKDIHSTTTKKSAPRFIKPSLSEVREYIFEKGFQISAEAFFNYYESNGWKVGRNSMKNWKAAVCTWQAKEKKGLSASSERPGPRATDATKKIINNITSYYEYLTTSN